MSVPGQPHDALFRALLDSPARAAALIRDHLPPEVAERLSAGPPRPIDGTFIDDALAESRSDRLFAVTLTDGRAALLYVLLEHKSAPDPATPLQLLGYMVAIWKRHLAQTPDPPTRLPPIIPVVFYHGARPWTVPPSVLDCIDADDRLRPWIDRFAYVLRDLGPIPYEALSRERAVRAALGALKHAFERGVTRGLLARLIGDLPDDDPLTMQVLRYIVRVYDTTAADLRAAVEQAKPDRRDDLMPTVAQEWMQQGRAEGLLAGEAKGRAEGLRTGKAEGKAEMLLRMMRRRFGTVPDAVETRVRHAGAETLDAWSERLLDAATPADVVGSEHER